MLVAAWTGWYWGYGKSPVDKRHMAQIVRYMQQDETKRVTSETRREKVKDE